MSGSIDIFLWFIFKKYLIASSSIYFQEFTNMSKNHHITKFMKELNVYRKEFRDRQDISDEIQTTICLIIDYLQTSIEKVISC